MKDPLAFNGVKVLLNLFQLYTINYLEPIIVFSFLYDTQTVSTSGLCIFLKRRRHKWIGQGSKPTPRSKDMNT